MTMLMDQPATETNTARLKRERAEREAVEREAKRNDPREIEKRIRENERFRNKAIRVSCSEPWTEFIVAASDKAGIKATVNNLPRALARRKIYPPAAENTPMLACHCDHCHGIRFWPAAYVTSRGYSTECSYEHMSDEQIEGLPPSPGIIDMARMKANARAGLQYHER